ncbi:MAG: hypothetical protein HY317_02550 [Acidobacteria bacterium]|nr:hypothetical protein [Acidobacteriota bacterium]
MRRRRPSRVSSLFARGLVTLLALAACDPAGPPAPIRIAVHNDPISLDPHLQNDVLTYGVLANVFEALTVFDSELRAGPSLASGWENPDERTWRFHLRPGARFHDGRPLEAADVVSSLERARHHPKTSVAGFLVEIEKVTAMGSAGVEIRTRRAFPILLNKLAFVFVVPRDAPGEITTPVGSGAYRFSAYERGRVLRLDPAATDAGLLPLELVPVRDPRERTRRLLAGEVDVVQDLDPADARGLEAGGDYRVVARTSSIIEYLGLRVGDPRFADPRVRRAIHLALDRRRLVEATQGGYGQPAGQMVGPGIFGYDPGLLPPERDLEAARRLLAEAGQGRGFAVTLEYRDGRRGDEIARQLRDLRLVVDLRSAPWPDLYPRLRAGAIDFYYGGVATPSADASDIFDSFVHTQDEGRGYGQTNFIGYSNAALDEIVEQSGVTLDLVERRGLLQEGMRVLMDDLYLIPLLVPHDVYGIRRGVEWQPRLDRMLLGRHMRRGR